MSKLHAYEQYRINVWRESQELYAVRYYIAALSIVSWKFIRSFAWTCCMEGGLNRWQSLLLATWPLTTLGWADSCLETDQHTLNATPPKRLRNFDKTTDDTWLPLKQLLDNLVVLPVFKGHFMEGQFIGSHASATVSQQKSERQCI